MTQKTVPLELFDYKKESKTLLITSEYFAGCFPRTVNVKSHKTGNVVEFVPLHFDDPLFDQDGWDGCQMGYKAKTLPLYLFIYHAF